MSYAPFYVPFPDVAAAETRCLTAFEDPLLPADKYVLMELYCDEIDCDCRRVFFHVYAEARKEFVAIVAYGWETKGFYREWAHEDDKDLLEVLQGPILNPGSPQSEIAPALVERIRTVVTDRIYVERLKNHYRMFKRQLSGNRLESEPTREDQIRSIGRNQLCPCGSGKKYKYCCGK